jgi:hypothetical protein
LPDLQKPRSRAKMERIMMLAWLMSARNTASWETCSSPWSINTKKRMRQMSADTRMRRPKKSPLLAPTQSTLKIIDVQLFHLHSPHLVYVIIFLEVTDTRSISSSPQNLHGEESMCMIVLI